MPIPLAPAAVPAQVTAYANLAFTKDYYPTDANGDLFDPEANGGAVTRLDIYATQARTGTPLVTVIGAVKVTAGRYRFSVPTPGLAAGIYFTIVTWTPTSTYTVKTDSNDTITVLDFAGSFAGAALCTLAEVKLQLNKTSAADDVELQSYIDSVTAPIEDYCGAVLPRSVTEKHNPRGAVLVLREERLSAIASVTEYLSQTGYVLTSAASPANATTYSYFQDPSLPTVLERWGASGYPEAFRGQVFVVYTAGFATVPAAINLAARMIVQTMWRTQNGGAGLPQLSDEPLVDVAGFDAPIPARAEMMLNRYRRVAGIA